MATLSNLVVRITGNTATLNARRSPRRRAACRRFRKGASKALGVVRKAAAGLAIAGVASITAFGVKAITSFADAGDEIQKMALRTGFSTEALSELKFAAEQAGTTIDTVEKGSKRLSATIFDAGLGLKTATDAFDGIGVSAAQLKGLSPEDQFNTIAAALSKVEDASTRSALAQKLFGRAGTELLPLFAQGEKGIEALRMQAQKLGVVFSQDAANSAADFKDAQNELKSALSGVFFTLGKEVVPVLAKFARTIIDNKPAIVGFFQDVKDRAAPFIETFRSGLQVVIPIVKSLFSFIIDNKPVLIGVIAAIGAAIVLSLGPVSLAILAILGIITAVGYVRDNWDAIWGEVLRIWETVSGAIVGVYESKFGWLLPGGPLIKGLLFVKRNWRETWEGMRDVFKGIVNTILGFINALIRAWNGLSFTLPEVRVPFVGTFGGFTVGTPNIPEIPMLQEGGITTRATLAQLHPNEAVIPLDSPQGRRSGMGSTVNINFYGDVLTSADFDERINQAIVALER